MNENYKRALMAEHVKEEILYMLRSMGEKADLDNCESLEEYAEWLEEMTPNELYDTHSIVYRSFSTQKEE